jgi:toll-like receptor 13
VLSNTLLHVQVIDEVQASCVDKVGILVGAAACTFCLLVAVVSAVLYRFRWKLRYLYYASRLAYRPVDRQREERQYAYDAFVSYSSDNADFVEHELTEELETRAGLKLNVHNRNFTPGRPIPSNIVEAVQSSRRTLVVLSPELLGSDWCEYELQMATAEAAYTGRDVLLFLLYRHVSSERMPRELLYNLQNSTYIDYPAHGDADILRDFWDRLAQGIRQ